MALPEDFGGSEQNSWPNYKGLPVQEVLDLLEVQVLAPNGVFVQRPDSYISRPRPDQPVDLTKDVWLYPDENDTVVVIPKRGAEHHSPVSGWTELLGRPWEEAKAAILEEIIGVKVVYGKEGFPRDKMYDIERVFLDVGEDGKVAIVPKLG